MSGPTTTNPTATQADTIIKDIENVLVPVIQAQLRIQIPALDLPVIKQISDIVEQLTANYLTKFIETGVTFAIIDTQTGAEQIQISGDLAAIEADEASGNQTKLTQDEGQYAKDQSALANDSGSASPQ